MKPIQGKSRSNDNEEYCGKCRAKVGYYTITGAGENDWGYTSLSFCGSCGEPVERPTYEKKKGKVIYSCGCYELTTEDFEVGESEKQVGRPCRCCERIYRMNEVRDGFEYAVESYFSNMDRFAQWAREEEDIYIPTRERHIMSDEEIKQGFVDIVKKYKGW